MAIPGSRNRPSGGPGPREKCGVLLFFKGALLKDPRSIIEPWVPTLSASSLQLTQLACIAHKSLRICERCRLSAPYRP
jgi:hypothetical protein